MPRAVDPPEISPSVLRALTAAAHGVGLLAAVTPRNAAAERARLAEAFARGNPTLPDWDYAAHPQTTLLRQVLDAARHGLGAASDPITRMFALRADELAHEIEMVEHRGTAQFASLSAERFQSTREGDALAETLANVATGTDDSGDVWSDDEDDAASVVSKVRSLIGAMKIPFRVQVRPDLVPLAATGDGVVLVATRRKITRKTAARTALHEVMGHALPRARAAAQPLRIFAIGTPGGVDEQEGYALNLEDRFGFLVDQRARELAMRHAAVSAMREGADVVECVRRLDAQFDVDHETSLPIVLRAHRGGDGRHGGLGREIVYLASLGRVRTLLAATPEDERVLGSGQVAVRYVAQLRAYTLDQ